MEVSTIISSKCCQQTMLPNSFADRGLPKLMHWLVSKWVRQMTILHSWHIFSNIWDHVFITIPPTLNWVVTLLPSKGCHAWAQTGGAENMKTNTQLPFTQYSMHRTSGPGIHQHFLIHQLLLRETLSTLCQSRKTSIKTCGRKGGGGGGFPSKCQASHAGRRSYLATLGWLHCLSVLAM